jgi:hypothetical protein
MNKKSPSDGPEREHAFVGLLKGTLNALGVSSYSIEKSGKWVLLGDNIKIPLPGKRDSQERAKEALISFLSQEVAKHVTGLCESYKSQEIQNLYFGYREKHRSTSSEQVVTPEEDAGVSMSYFVDLKKVGGFRVYQTDDSLVVMYAEAPKTYSLINLGLMGFHQYGYHCHKIFKRNFTEHYPGIHELTDYSLLDDLFLKMIQFDIAHVKRLKKPGKSSVQFPYGQDPGDGLPRLPGNPGGRRDGQAQGQPARPPHRNPRRDESSPRPRPIAKDRNSPKW